MFANKIIKYKKNISKILMVYSSLLLSKAAFANGETPISEGLYYITNAMYGATGIAIATISVMITGLLCLGGFVKWTTLGFTIIGISIIFGAGAIVTGLTSLIHVV